MSWFSITNTLCNFNISCWLNFCTHELFTIFFMNFSKARSYCNLFITDHSCSFTPSTYYSRSSRGMECTLLNLVLKKLIRCLKRESSMPLWHYLDLESTNLASHLTYSGIHIMLSSMYIYIYIYVGTSLVPYYLFYSYLFNIIQFYETLQPLTQPVSSIKS
jgi:hypothetical protein